MNITPTNHYNPRTESLCSENNKANYVSLKELEGENVSVEEFHDLFEEVEFGNSVG